MPGAAAPRLAAVVMRAGRAPRILTLAGAAALAAGCAAAPLPAMRPLAHQSAADQAWDARTCAWAAEDASGYWADLSPPENRIMEAFTYGPSAERSEAGPVVGGPGDGAGSSGPSPSHLGRGGRGKFEEVYAQCMQSRGYERTPGGGAR
jgi:hypothetical protein